MNAGRTLTGLPETALPSHGAQRLNTIETADLTGHCLP
jgi:hypothetical protein